MNTVWAPTSVTRAETFLWYSATPRLQLGVAYLWKQSAVRYLASYRLVDQQGVWPSVNASAGVQGIGTGNPGYSITFERSETDWTAYIGLGFRSNESHSHPLGGVKWTFTQGWTMGLQHDGHAAHPFLTYDGGSWTAGFYVIGFKSPALMTGFRF